MRTRDDVLKKLEKLTGYSVEVFKQALSELDYELVPVHTEPFRSMAGARSLRDSMNDENFTSRARSCWAAMLAARAGKP